MDDFKLSRANQKTIKTPFKGIWQHILLSLFDKSFEVTIILVVKFLITCLVSEILKDKKEQRY